MKRRWSSGVCIAGLRKTANIVRAEGGFLVKLRLPMRCVLEKPGDCRYLLISWWANALPGDRRRLYDLTFVQSLFRTDLSSALATAFT